MSELKHATTDDRDLTQIGYNLLTMAFKMDAQDPDQNQLAQDLCTAAHIMFSLSDFEDAMRILWENMHP